MPETDLALLLRCATAAGDIAKGHFQQNPDTWDKADGAGPVTEADLAVNAMLERELRRARPDYGWLSEESDDNSDRQSYETVFIIDPIDGTRAFIEGSRDWGHSLAIAHNGIVTAAVVAMPVRDQTFGAAAGQGATLNGSPIRVTGTKDPASSNVLVTKPNLAPANWKSGAPPPFRRSFRSSLAYRMALSAMGRYDAMLTLRPTWEWDIAAGALIVAEAGGVASDRTGAALRFNNPTPQVNGVVAGGGLHPALIAALA